MKSIIAFLTLLLFFSCSSKKTDKELFDEAKASLKDQKYPEAVMSFEELVKAYPESELAPEALSETASIYQNKQIKNLSEKENLNKAIKLLDEQIGDLQTGLDSIGLSDSVNIIIISDHGMTEKLSDKIINVRIN